MSNITCDTKVVEIKEGNMKNHYLKTVAPYFQDVLDGIKTFEYRRNDRDFKVGDVLILKEWTGSKYTGRVVKAQITYLLQGVFTIPLQDAVLGIRLLPSCPKPPEVKK